MSTKEKKGGDKTKKKDDKKLEKEETLTEDEKKKKEDLELLLERISETNNKGLQKVALEALKKEIRSSTSSVTSIPLVLKLLVEFWDNLKASYSKTPPENKELFSDVMSVLAMTMGEDGDSIKYKIEGTIESLEEWGHEYVRFLSREIGTEYEKRDKIAEEKGKNELKPEDILDIMSLVNKILPYLMKNNRESAAIDLLLEVDHIVQIKSYATPKNYKRIVRYLEEISRFHICPENHEIIMVAYEICTSQNINNVTLGMRLAMIMNRLDLMNDIFKNEKDDIIKRQLSFMLSRQGIVLTNYFEDDSDDEEEEEEGEKDNDNMIDEGEEDDGESDDDDDGGEMEILDSEEDIRDRILNNEYQSDHFIHFAKELDSMDPKNPSDIYKMHLSTSRQLANTINSAKQNLASSYVNGFANAGFCVDSLLSKEDSDWVHRNKESGKIGAAASLGMIFMWNVDEGLNRLDKFLYSTDIHIQAGALLGMGIVSTGVRLDEDPVFGVLKKYVIKKDREIRLSAILGLGISYAGSFHSGATELLEELVSNSKEAIDIVCISALAIGMINCGGGTTEKCEDLVMLLLELFQNKPKAILKGTFLRFAVLGLGLLFFGVQDGAETIMQSVVTLDKSIARFVAMAIEVCAYAGSGNVIKIQELIAHCGEHYNVEDKDKKSEDEKKKEMEKEKELQKSENDNNNNHNQNEKEKKEKKKSEKEIEEEKKKKKEDEKEDTRFQTIACLGIAMLAMGEDIGSEMVVRIFNHMLHYSDKCVKKAVPLALGLLYISNPKLEIIDILSKLSHDGNIEISQNAILALGLIGAGTNNARLAQMLRSLAEYYAKDPNHLYLTRLAQGLVFMGKGLITLNPFISDRKVLKQVSMAGILPLLFSALDMNTFLLNQYHYFFYTVATAMSPRYFITVDVNMKPLPVSVRVGQAVDTVAKAGHRKTITGFQTHDTPVILMYNERAELATNKYITMNGVLEGVVIVKKSKHYEEKEEKKEKEKKK